MNCAAASLSTNSAAPAVIVTAESTPSRSVMVCAVGVPSTEFVGLASVTTMVSSGSATPSLMSVSGMSFTVSPAAKVSVPGASV